MLAFLSQRRFILHSCSRLYSSVMATEEGPEKLSSDCPQDDSSADSAKPLRVFDYSKYNQRHIALLLAYLGENYQGFAIQDPPHVTIESCLFDALERTKLIQDRQSCRYSRCGRTDKGVSAFGQVVSLQVRSNLIDGPGVIIPQGSKAHTRNGDKAKELPYLSMLNHNLPEDIRILGWANVERDFSARFSCKTRTYKYYFPQGDLSLAAMRTAAQHFLGQHDFRNFCKMDISGGVTNFVRTLCKFEINAIDSSLPVPYQMCEAMVTGRAFLMHQVRYMMSILFLVGSGLEKPSIVAEMLDLNCCPRKPQYGMAAPEPLVLFRCEFEGVEWQREEWEGLKVITHFRDLWTMQAIKTAMVQQMMDSLCSGLSSVSLPSLAAPLMTSNAKLKSKNYRPLLQRPTSESFEDRYEHHMSKKRRLDEKSPESDQQAMV